MNLITYFFQSETRKPAKTITFKILVLFSSMHHLFPRLPESYRKGVKSKQGQQAAGVTYLQHCCSAQSRDQQKYIRKSRLCFLLGHSVTTNSQYVQIAKITHSKRRRSYNKKRQERETVTETITMLTIKCPCKIMAMEGPVTYIR